ncbi:MAG: 50S ribosomal protein L29 [Bacteroidetes bacterium]|nr:50S ribosomal protein L29 [Bacteroidota bacterium]
MKAKEIRELSVEEIEQQIAVEREQIAQLRFQHAVADLPNPIIMRDKRRLVAKLETIIRQKTA